VARKYLIDKHLSVAVLDPVTMEQKTSSTSSAPAGGHHVN
jgi:hypothetical protein